MAVVAGYRKAYVFEALSYMMLKRTGSVKTLGISLVSICFFCSMFVTNDVKLITFVPFTIGVLRISGHKNLIFVIVMETIAANLGSMMTPIGNPQNLFLFRFYDMRIGDFFHAILPLGLISFLLIAAIMLFQKSGRPVSFSARENVKLKPIDFLKYTCLLILCLLTVLHLLDYRITFVLVCAVLLLKDRELFARVDYMLLLTFVCFFIFVGNIGSIGAIRDFIKSVITGRELLVSALLSQGISNVPSAVMLASFTDNAGELLKGVNIGGLGTLIASFASLISYKYYSAETGARTGRYLGVFSILNFSIFVILILISSVS
jgi:Na+/H+ antiporter NhaD/arsenite permease-like protein